ncbi:MAG: GNAT family N-acetyltransferase [Kofleriaceae bacterium]
MSFQAHRDAWLSEVMARPVFRVDGNGSAAELPDDVGFYFAKVPTDRIADVTALTAKGFQLVDTAVTFELTHEVTVTSSVDVRECSDADAAAVLDIAGSAFRYSRFHLDPAVGQEMAHHVKREWIANYVKKVRGDALLVGFLDGKPAGFLAALVSHGTAAIDLVAVATSAHGKGVGSALCAAFAKRYAGMPRVVGTQVVNVPSIRMYTKLGYELARSQYVLHRHVGAR